MDDQFPGANRCRACGSTACSAGFGWLDWPGPRRSTGLARWVLVVDRAAGRWRSSSAPGARAAARAAGSSSSSTPRRGAGLLALLGWPGHHARVGRRRGRSSRRATCCRCCRSTRPPSRSPRGGWGVAWGRTGRRLRGARLRARAARAAAHVSALLRMSSSRSRSRRATGRAHLERCSPPCGRQTVDRPEIVVVDSGSRTGRAELAGRHGARVEVIPRAAFSHGAHAQPPDGAGRGDHVAFLTQDAEPADERWLARLLEPRLAGPG